MSADILFDFPVAGTPAAVFAAVATPEGLDKWWTRSAEGDGRIGATWRLDFGGQSQWDAEVRAFEQDRLIEWEITRSDPDWRGTRVRLELESPPGGLVWIRFAHRGWQDATEHYRISAYCWAMYLRVMKQWVQRSQTVPYDRRLEI